MPISVNHFTEWYYWLNFRPEPLSVRGQVFLKGVLLALLIILSLNLLYLNWKKRDKILAKGAQKVVYWAAVFIFLGALLYWFAYEGAAVLAARLWWLLWLLLALGWLALIIKYFIKDIPRQKKQQLKQEEFKKYLPKKK